MSGGSARSTTGAVQVSAIRARYRQCHAHRPVDRDEIAAVRRAQRLLSSYAVDARCLQLVLQLGQPGAQRLHPVAKLKDALDAGEVDALVLGRRCTSRSVASPQWI
jgi:hypothetical protein